MSEFTEAAQALSIREHAVQERLARDVEAVAAGEEPSRSEFPSIGDAYSELLHGMSIDGDELVSWAEGLVQETAQALDVEQDDAPADLRFVVTGRDLRSLFLGVACQVCQLWYTRQLRGEAERAGMDFDPGDALK